MEKLNMKTKNLVSLNIEKIGQLFPNCIVESGKGKSIDFEVLKQELSNDIVDDRKEKYQLTWSGKREAIVNANTPTTKTLRPIREKSVDFDNTNNIYIEGDNLEALKILQESYLNKIKCIYIDPPYNTGNDFIYNDNYSKSATDELEESGQVDEYNNKLITNSDSNGKYHSDWLSMMYPRLKLARNLLTNDGVIFISIDDNEVDNLKKICNEIFGEKNFVAQIPWQSRASIQNDTDFSVNHEYICVFAKNRRMENRRLKESNYKIWHENDSFVFKPLPLDKDKFDNPDNDSRGLWKADPFDAPHIRPNLTYKIKNGNTGVEYLPPNGRCWRTEQNKYLQLLADNRIVFGKDGKSRPQLKVFYEEKKELGSIENSWFSADKIGTSTLGTKELIKLFDGKAYFDTPKPTNLIYKILDLANIKSSDIVLDFFSGSATTAHAILKYCSENKIKINFIMTQIPEKCSENTEAYKDGYQTICDIGEERIRKAAKIIKEETNANIDYGFRVYKVDSSNMKDVYYLPIELKQNQLDLFESNTKDDRTSEDLLTQVILDLGLTLDLKIEEKKILNNNVYFVEENSLVACFDNEININIIDEICKCEPLKIVFKESSFKTDSDKINTFERIKKLSNETEICII